MYRFRELYATVSLYTVFIALPLSTYDWNSPIVVILWELFENLKQQGKHLQLMIA